MHGARQQWRDDGNGLVERSSDRAASWSVSEGGRLEVGVTCPRIFAWLPRSNSLFWPRIPCSLKKLPVRPPKLPVPLLKFGHLFPSLGLRT